MGVKQTLFNWVADIALMLNVAVMFIGCLGQSVQHGHHVRVALVHSALVGRAVTDAA